MNETFEKTKQLALSLSVDERIELGELLNDSLSGPRELKDDLMDDSVSEVLRDRINGPFVAIYDFDSHLSGISRTVRDGLDRRRNSEGKHA